MLNKQNDINTLVAENDLLFLYKLYKAKDINTMVAYTDLHQMCTAVIKLYDNNTVVAHTDLLDL